MDKNQINQNMVFLMMRGSQAYGTNTPESDIDYGGICMPSLDVMFGIDQFDQEEDWGNDEHGIKIDKSIYVFNKAIHLMAENNPNMMDYLCVPDRCVVQGSAIWDIVQSNADMFVSLDAKGSFLGYALSQLSRIKTHREYLLNPPAQPKREDYGLPPNSIFPESQYESIAIMSSNFVKQEDRNQFYSEMAYLLDTDGAFITKKYVDIADFKIAIEFFKVRQEQFLRMMASINGMFLAPQYHDAAKRELKYIADKKNYKRYIDWSKKRNEKRKALEQKCGYDCYIDGTEFLTDSGWKVFDDITELDKLATIFWDVRNHDYAHRHRFSVEYQHFVDRFDGIYNGNMYHLTGQHMDCVVTANHNMLIQKQERATGKQYDWELLYSSNLPDTFNVLNTCTPVIKTFGSHSVRFADLPINALTYLRLMGWFLSEGTVQFNANGDPDAIVITQKKGNHLYPYMIRFANKYKTILGVSIYESIKPANDVRRHECIEVILRVSNRHVVNRLYTECGHGSKEKRIPRYVMGLSKVCKETLFDAMVNGDGTGTVREHKTIPDNIVYYTSNRLLADDVHELCFLCGWVASKWGPYKYDDYGFASDDKTMYQVFCDKNKSQIKTLVRSANVDITPVVNQRIVCFSVPNGTLVTRYNGTISMHGNCKHGMHLLRLTRMAAEIMEGKGILVDRTHIDADELRDIRLGNQSYETVMEKAKAAEDRADAAYHTSTLPLKPNYEAITEMRRKIMYDWATKYFVE